MGDEGVEAGHRVESSRPGTLTFADDPVEDGPQLLDADLHVLGGEGGWHLPWGNPSVPQNTRHQAQPTSPASCLKRDLKFSSISSSESTCWREKTGRAGQGRPSLASAWPAAAGGAGSTHQLGVTSFRASLSSSVKWESSLYSIPAQNSCGLNVEAEVQSNDEGRGWIPAA